MGAKWETFVDSLETEADETKKNVKNFVKELQTSTSDFLKAQGDKIVVYTEQLADGKITTDEYKGYMEDIKILVEMKAAGKSAEGKKKMVDVGEKIAVLVIKGIVAAAV